ncbi:hypothetical protein [Sphingomonas sp. 22R3R2A-7]|uniref:hypothetical protein n=1 Tax=Sphingomonas sp. 22R3R2A-7 TaxID=3050230 RepID=UPI002FE1DCEC
MIRPPLCVSRRILLAQRRFDLFDRDPECSGETRHRGAPSGEGADAGGVLDGGVAARVALRLALFAAARAGARTAPLGDLERFLVVGGGCVEPGLDPLRLFGPAQFTRTFTLLRLGLALRGLDSARCSAPARRSRARCSRSLARSSARRAARSAVPGKSGPAPCPRSASRRSYRRPVVTGAPSAARRARC